jgi:hypothetical protein
MGTAYDDDDDDGDKFARQHGLIRRPVHADPDEPFDPNFDPTDYGSDTSTFGERSGRELMRLGGEALIGS